MTLIIIAIVLLSFLLIATENITNINKAAIAIFAGTVGWVLYICYGTDFVMGQHPQEYADYLSGATATSLTAKQFIAERIFLPNVGRAAEIVLFLLATMTIVEVLNINGCFDFISQLLKTRNSQKMLWNLSAITLLLSANLDNLTTTLMMLTIMHGIIQSRRQRMIFASAIVVAASCGGALTVIGDPLGLVLWNLGNVTATHYSMTMMVPCLLTWLTATYWIGRMLPERCDTGWITLPYRGDDTRLAVWQRLLMLFVGIGGLWFIPTFHNITQLSPFLGALCVLSVLWVVNEIVNRKLISTDPLAAQRKPQVMKYSVMQMMLYVMGIMLAIGVVGETGVLRQLSVWCHQNIDNVWIFGILSGAVSCFLDSFATAMTAISIPNTTLQQAFAQDGIYWPLVAYCTSLGGCVLGFSSISGFAMLKIERMHIGWYFKNVGWKVIVTMLIGVASMYLLSV